jgi:two-component system sensor histidine kinase YesM
MDEGISRFRFRNISILQKMLLILLVTFLIPLTVLGALLVLYIGARDEEYQNRQDMAVLESVSRELAETFKAAEGIAELITAKGLAWKFSGCRETYRDFVSLAELSDDIIRSIPLIKSIILFRDNRVIFERGPALDSDIHPYPEYLRAALESGGSPFWTFPQEMNYFYKTEGRVFPLYQALNAGAVPLVLVVGLDEKALSVMYSSYSRGRLFLLNAEGGGLSVGGDGPRGETTYPQELFRRFSGSRGWFRAFEQTLVLYARGHRGWYLVNHIPDAQYRLRRRGLYGIVLLAALLGICFASACLIMQRRYIFNPLKNMLKEMGEFREGNLEAKMSYRSGDEIGRINREVEGIFNRIHDLIHEVYINKIYNQEATLKMLTSQINPHFLYNTLDSIRWKAVQNRDLEVAEQIEALSDLFRHNLSKGNDLVTVEQEIKHLETYLYIMNFRFRNRIQCTFFADAEVKGVRMPKLVLQPIVENAILHGIEKRIEPGKIDVCIRAEEGRLKITVSDDGIGTDSAAINRMLKDKEDSRTVFALQNINRRIKLYYGETYGLEFDSIPGRGTVVTVIMPLNEKRYEKEKPATQVEYGSER